LSRVDLVEAARKKLKSPARKLELAAYKERLLAQARGNDGNFWSSFAIHGRSSSMIMSSVLDIGKSSRKLFGKSG
jgi:hypothetical protein